jgi:hypothetical protein
LLALASGLVEATTPRPADRWPRSEIERPDGPAVFMSFIESGWPALAALARAVATLHPDEVLAARLRAALGADVPRGAPRWLATMGAIEITDTLIQTDPLGDGENLMVGWVWPDGPATTMIVYVDHNLGTMVKDAFAIPEHFGAIAADYRRIGGPHVSLAPISAADARARIAQAVETGERMLPPIQTDAWPSCRPMLDWLVSHMPAGGVGYVRPDWPQARRDQLLDEFIASPFARVPGLTGSQVRELADPLMWFACDHGPGDPLRWSPVSVEIVLTDWYQRTVLHPHGQARQRVPDVLAAFVRFAHQRTGIPSDLTDDTLESVDRCRSGFARAIDRPGRSREVADTLQLALAAAGLDLDDDWDDSDDDWDDSDDLDDLDDLDDEAFMAQTVNDLEATVIELVGGREAYEVLDDNPLDDRPIAWDRVPPGVRDAALETLSHLDGWSRELFDDEVRTIARHLLVAVLEADPSVFKRSPRTDALAAAILAFLMIRLTARYSAEERHRLPWQVFTQKDLARTTGLSPSTVSSRTRTITGVVDRARIDWPSLLHSTQRREALRMKHLIVDLRRDHPAQ